jgi:hypothetical protein
VGKLKPFEPRRFPYVLITAERCILSADLLDLGRTALFAVEPQVFSPG